MSTSRLLLFWVVLGLLGSLVVTSAAELKVLRGHVPEAVAGLPSKGRVPGTQELRLAIGVPLRDPAGLDKFLADVYNPASPNYRHFLTPEEFAARFSASEAEYAAVKTFALSNGFAITAEHGNRLLLDVVGKAADVERSFHIRLYTYQHPTEEREFFAPDTEPTLDTVLPVADVQGLSDFSRPHPLLHPANPGAVSPNSGSAPDGSSYFGNDFRNAYAPGVGLSGTGQAVGLFQADGFYSADITKYAQQAGGGRTNIVIQTVLLDGFSGNPTTGANSGNGEVSLDIEMAMAMAPGLSRIILFEGNPNNFIPNDILNAMAASNTVKNSSSSWGWSGGPSTTMDTIFQLMSAQGQSFFNASGDSDAFTVGSSSVNGVDNPSNFGAPSSCPYITEVGGTTLTMNGVGASYASETVWNWGLNGSQYVGSSGGVSSYYSIPTWQQGISMTANQGSTTQRNIPDVALTADQVYVYYGNGSSGVFGGTSCAAPLWAGFMALVNQQFVLNTGSSTNSAGFINPAIYTIGKGLNGTYSYAACFHDTTSGNNFWPSSPTNYPAVAGYDLCTGWGTLSGQTLINALAGQLDPLGVTPITGFSAAGYPGGPFSPSSLVFTLTNSGAQSLNWSLINTSAWLNVSTASGALPASGQTTVTVSLNSAASSLAVGAYSATVVFLNQASGVLQGRLFTLQISEPLRLLTTSGFTATGGAGGPFVSASQTVVFTNSSANAVAWSLVNTSAWLSVSASSGSIAGNNAATVLVSTNSLTATLPNGIYSATVVLSNQASHVTQSLVCSASIGQNIVQNGGFETGSFSGWSLTGTPNTRKNTYNAVVRSSSFNGSASFIHSGTYGAYLGDNIVAILSQNLSTIPGQTYLLSFWLDNPTSGSGQQFLVNWNTTSTTTNQVFYLNNPPALAWTNVTLFLRATGTNTTLQFGAANPPNGFGLDDISVAPVNPPVIAQQPASRTNSIGSIVIFTAAAGGSPPLAYQWRDNGTNVANGGNVSGALSNVLAFASAAATNAGNYTLVVTNLYGAVTSAVATLTIAQSPGFSGTLAGRIIECGANTNVFSIAPIGTPPISIQWRLDGVPVSGATNTAFALTNLLSPSHSVTVTVTNLYGSVSSNTLLTVADARPPAITLLGGNPLTNELAVAFTDPGALASDTCAGPLPVAASGSVNINLVGTYTLTYAAADPSGNSNSITRTVVVRDTTPPTILWSFTNLVLAADSNCVAVMPEVTGTNFVLATDASGALTLSQSPTNHALLPLGTNEVVITAADASGNASSVTNQIVVRDLTPPLIALNGASPLFAMLGAAFADPGAATSDDCTGIALFTTNGVVNTGATGTNELVYWAADGAGNTNSASRIVVVFDPTPVITSVAAPTADSVTLTFTGATNLSYVLQATSDLQAPDSWQALVTNTPDASGGWSFTDTQVTNSPQRFYRLKLLP